MEDLSNQKIADLLRILADIYEAEEEDYYKIRAYRQAANVIKRLPYNLSTRGVESDFTDIPRVGKAISHQIKYILLTGKFHLQPTTNQAKPFFSELKLVPGLGPKRRKLLYKHNIYTIKQLKDWIAKGELKKIKNFGNKLESSISLSLSKLKKYEKHLKWFRAAPIIEGFLEQIKLIPGVLKAEAASEYRRKKELVGNIDIVIAIEDNKFSAEKICNLSSVKEIVNQNKDSVCIILYSGL